MGESRRDFIKKTGLAASGVVIGGAGLGSKKAEQRVVQRVRPLGFQWETKDPFLFCVHHEDHYPTGNGKLGPQAALTGRNLGQDFLIKDGWRMYHGRRIPGFPEHPHRGFETITVVRDGYIDHSDSLGGAARYGHGDLQWMTAGRGVQHAEMFPLVHTEKENRLELFQIWLNLPKKSKMVKPYYKMNWSEEIPIISELDANGKAIRVEVLAGSLKGKHAPASTPDSWAADKNNHVGIYAIKLEAGAKFTLPKTAEGVNRSIYFFEGNNINIEGYEVPQYHGVDVDSTADIHMKNGNAQAQLLVLQGRPLNEPVVQHGPFVMNTREEIQEAFTDFQRTRFGGWPWSSADPTHGNTPRRFAKHPDGREEVKPGKS